MLPRFLGNLRSWLSGAPIEFLFLSLLVTAGFIALSGLFQEVIWLPFGQLPTTPSGLLAVVLLVAFAAFTTATEKKAVRHLRPEAYGPPTHRASMWFAIAMAAVATISAWNSSGVADQKLHAGTVGLVVLSLAYLIIGLPWSATVEATWIRKNALTVQESYYVVEGSNDGASWQSVCRADIGNLLDARAKAHAEYERVRFWEVKCLVSLMESHFASNLTVSEPIPAERLRQEDVQRAMLGRF